MQEYHQPYQPSQAAQSLQQPIQYQPQQFQPQPATQASQQSDQLAQQPAQDQAPPSQQPVQQQSPQRFAQQLQAQPATQASQQPAQLSVQQPELAQQGVQQQFTPAQPEPSTSPFVDIYDTPEEVTIVADLPGCEPDDIELEVTNNTLRIIGERREDEEDSGRRSVQRERLRRSERIITLPADVEVEEAEAACETGVCTITLPKSETGRQKRIGVQ